MFALLFLVSAKEVTDEKSATVLAPDAGAIPVPQPDLVAVDVDAKGNLAQLRYSQQTDASVASGTTAAASSSKVEANVATKGDKSIEHQVVSSNPHTHSPSFSFSAIEKTMAKRAKASAAAKASATSNATQAVDPDQAKKEEKNPDSEAFKTGSLRTFDGIIPTTDDDYPYQCACQRKSAITTNTIMGSLAEKQSQTDTKSEKTKLGFSGDYNGHCKNDALQGCVAIPGDNAAICSLALLAVLFS